MYEHVISDSVLKINNQYKCCITASIKHSIRTTKIIIVESFIVQSSDTIWLHKMSWLIIFQFTLFNVF